MEMEKGIQSSPELQNSPHPRKAGGWKSMKYIIGNETFEKLASMSLIANITVYLRTKYYLDGILLVNIVTVWFATCNFAPLAGAYISDAYLGRFRTLILGSLSSFLGMGIMTLTAAFPQLRPPSCHEETHCKQPQKWQLGFLLMGMGFLAVGAGGIRPCNVAFGADQFDITTEKGRAQLESFFNWYYFSFTIALLVALTGVVYIQSSVSWVLGLAIPTACLALSIFVFLLGSGIYIYAKPQGSVFLDIAKVIVAAFKKKHLRIRPDSHYSLNDPPPKGSDPATAKLPHTNRFTVLDKAAVIADPDELNNEGMPKNSWRLCSVQQVEQLKCLISILPVWLSGITCFTVMDQQNTFGVLQAIQMNTSIGRHFKIPPGWMGISGMIALSIWILIYERLYIPYARKRTNKDVRLTLQQRIRTGIVFSILCMLVAGVVEKQRRDTASKHRSFASPMSVAWLLPQFVLSGMTEAFAAVAIMEFLTKQLAERMRTVAGAIFFLSIAIASYISSLCVNVVHLVSQRGGGSAWLGGHDLNKNRLDYYYYIIAALGALNFIYFTFFASRYLPTSSSSDENGDGKGGIIESLMPPHATKASEDISEQKGLEMRVRG